jgi:hypothetical protein
MRQMTIILHRLLRTFAAALLCCCMLTQTASSQAPAKGGKQTDEPTKRPQKAQSDDTSGASAEALAKRKKALDTQDDQSVKSICSNC